MYVSIFNNAWLARKEKNETKLKSSEGLSAKSSIHCERKEKIVLEILIVNFLYTVYIIIVSVGLSSL